MIIRPILTAFCVTVAIFASAGAVAHGFGGIVKPNFEQAIPNLPGKSLVAVEVEYSPGALAYTCKHLNLDLAEATCAVPRLGGWIASLS